MGETETRPQLASLETICTQIFADSGAWRKVLIGGLLCLSIIGSPWAFGYFWKYLAQIRTSGDFTLPDWTDPMKLLLPGAMGLGVFLVWFALPWLIAIAIQAVLTLFSPYLGALGMLVSSVILWMVCGLYVSALWAFQRKPEWHTLIDVTTIWKPFAANWRSLLLPALAFMGLVGLFLPLLPFVFFGGFLPLIGYISQVYILTQDVS